MLAMASELSEDLVVADVLQHVERVAAALEHRHRFEPWAPRTVIPQHAADRQLVAGRGFHVPAADSQPAVAAYHHNLRAGPGKLNPDSHSDAMSHRRQR